MSKVKYIKILKFLSWFIRTFFAVLVGTILILTTVWNIYENELFLVMSIYQVLSILILIGFSVIYLQTKTKERRVLDAIEKVIGKLQLEISSDIILKPTSATFKARLTKQKFINNKITLLQDNLKYYPVESELKMIRKDFDDYRKIMEEVSVPKIYEEIQMSIETYKHEQADRLMKNIDTNLDRINIMIHRV